jgi:hypothetical protein
MTPDSSNGGWIQENYRGAAAGGSGRASEAGGTSLGESTTGTPAPDELKIISRLFGESASRSITWMPRQRRNASLSAGANVS